MAVASNANVDSDVGTQSSPSMLCSDNSEATEIVG
jgi:hypothetical protein